VHNFASGLQNSRGAIYTNRTTSVTN